MPSRLIVCVFLVSICVTARAQSRKLACLPDGIKTSDTVSVERSRPGRVTKRVTVGDKLEQLKARCRRGKLLSEKGRQVYFYHLSDCWGNPPANYLEIVRHQREEIEKLKRRYTVVEMACNTGDELIQ